MKTRLPSLGMALIGVLLAMPAQSRAADPCPPQLERVRATVPRYVNAGARFDLRAKQDHSVAEYAAYNAVADVSGTRVPVELSERSETGTKLRAPFEPGPFTVALLWEQVASDPGEGTAACSARRHLPVTALPVDAKIGDLSVARVEGRWRVRVRQLYGARRTQTLTSRFIAQCDVGACDFLTPKRARWRLGGDGRYHYAAREGRMDCPLVERRGGRVIRRFAIADGFTVRRRTVLAVVAARTGADGLRSATRLRGVTRLILSPTLQARKRGCVLGVVYRSRAQLEPL